MTYRSESRGIMYAAPQDQNDDEPTDVRAKSEATEEFESEATEEVEAEATEEIEAKTTEPAQTDSAAGLGGDSQPDEMEAVELGEASSTTDANWTGTIPADD